MTSQPFTELVEDYLDALRVDRGLAANTLIAYRRDLDQYLAHLEGSEPTAETVDDFIEQMSGQGWAEATIARKVAVIRGLHRFLVAEGMRPTDETALVEPPRRPAPFPKALTVDEAIAVVEAPDIATLAGRRDSALLEFLYGSGARVTEAGALDLGDVDLDDKVALVTGKGSKQRLIPLGTAAVTALRRWLPDRMELVRRNQHGDPMFLNLRGGRLTRQGVYRVVRVNAAAAGVDPTRVSPHVLRHSAATHMVEAGADLRSVQEILGHATISTTQVYTRVSQSHLWEIYVQSHPRSR